MIATEAICLSVDVEWAHPAILRDLQGLFDERGLKATFFCTGPGIDVGAHERGIHPNFRGDGDCLKSLVTAKGPAALANQREVYCHTIDYFKAFAPEARGVRGHSLHYDSQLLDIYRSRGIAYDSSYQLPLAADLRPFWKEAAILEIPIFYNDYFDLRTGATGFKLKALNLDRPGLKVVNVHPNIIFTNAPTLDFYMGSKAFYHDVDRLRALRWEGRGARDLLIEALDEIVVRQLPTATLGEIDTAWRAQSAPPWN